MSWLDWLIVAVVIIAIIVVIKFIQRVTAIVATILIAVVIIGLVIYFLSQWSLTPQFITDVIYHSSIGGFFANLGNWIFNTLLGIGEGYVN